MSDLEFQVASLSLREWALWVAIVQVGISAAQTGIVYYGIRAMIRAADQRGRDAERDRTDRAAAAADARREADRRHTEAMQAAAEARREADHRHAEAMQAAEAARREADRRHTEAMQAAADARRESDRRHAENMAAVNAMAATLAETAAALRVVVERTAPAPFHANR